MSEAPETEDESIFDPLIKLQKILFINDWILAVKISTQFAAEGEKHEAQIPQNVANTNSTEWLLRRISRDPP